MPKPTNAHPTNPNPGTRVRPPAPEPGRSEPGRESGRERDKRTVTSDTRQLQQARALLAGSGQFDIRFYLDTYPDVAAAGIDPIIHYLVAGASEGRDPSPRFSTRDYRATHPQAQSGNPLLDAIRTGFFERRPRDAANRSAPPAPPACDTPVSETDIEHAHRVLLGRPITAPEMIDAHLGGSRAGLIEALLLADSFRMDIAEPVRRHARPGFPIGHESVSPALIAWTRDFFGIGQPDQLAQPDRLSQPRQWPVLLDILLHDPALRQIVPESALRWADPAFLAAWSKFAVGYAWPADSQRDYDTIMQSRMFDTAWYLARYPDVSAGEVDPVYHYLTNGAAEGRDPGADFSTVFYFRENQDVAASGINPLVHYISQGRRQGRRPRPARDLPAAPGAIGAGQAPSGEAWRAHFAARLEQRIAALGDADLSPPFADPPDQVRRPTFSVTMTVFDTDPAFLRALACSVQGQAFTDFEWLILDNGSRSPATIDLCRQIEAGDPRVRLFRVEDNLHIIGGNRHLFERAHGHYIVPIDSDDLLYPDSLALLAAELRQARADPPVLLYSDEQKVDHAGQSLELIWRWGFSFAHAMATAPAAHLMAFSRDVAREAGVYTDDAARGSHDWDTLLRITERGGAARHVPEVLYGWRVHAASTASSSTAKDYIVASQSAVLARSLARRGLESRFEIRELFPGVLGWYHAHRARMAVPPVMVDIVVEAPFWDVGGLLHNLRQVSPVACICRVLYPPLLAGAIDQIRTAHPDLPVQNWIAAATAADLERELNNLPPGLLAKAIISNDVRLASSEALLDAIGTLELDSRAGVVGGPIVLGDIVSSLGLLGGLDGFVAAPFAGRHRRDIPGHLWAVRRPVTAFPIKAVVIRASLLESGLRVGGVDNRNCLHGLRFCLEALRRGHTIVHTFLMEAGIRYRLPVGQGADPDSKAALLREYAPEIMGSRYSVHLSRHAERFGQLTSPAELGQLPPYDTARLSPAIPLALRVEPALAAHPTVNLLLPAVRMESMSGGPNTALNIGYRLAALGFAVRLFSTDVPPDAEPAATWNHIVANGGGTGRPVHLQIVDASDRSRPVAIGANDVFFATAWWTAQMAHWASPLVAARPFLYLIQDFEPILYPASSAYGLALETYAFDHVPLINTALLRDYLVGHGIGKFADPGHAGGAIVFEPAVARDSFYPMPRVGSRRTLLFYARPSVGPRNLFEVGVAALQLAIDQGLLDPEEWVLIGMGEAFTPISLGRGATLECAPWLGFDEYATQMRAADILLSLMLSPHPSYPPLEMAACGGLVVTSACANKNAARLAGISPNIIAAEPTIAGVAAAIGTAVGRLNDLPARFAAARLSLPGSWDESFRELVPVLAGQLADLGVPADAARRPLPGEPRTLAAPWAEDSAYATFLAEAAARRAVFNAAAQQPGLISFVTTVWNTAPAFLRVLADSVRTQHGGTDFEWFVLDNGTTRADTRACLAELAREPYVRLQRVEANLGIIGGMRYCLERAGGRYILPLDSDDYLFPDCVQTLTWYIQKHDYPPLLYTDEDRLVDETLFMPYLKPDFDPVLFTNSCYIAHLCVIDRALALTLDSYGDPTTEGSHDWDSFTRFLNAGHVPVHVPEVLYSWRMHPQSTAGDIGSKPYVYESQKAVLRRFLAARPVGERFELRTSKLFDGSPDWWMRRRRIAPRPLTTLLIRHTSDGGGTPMLRLSAGIDHEVIELALADGPAALLPHVLGCAAAGRLVHVLASETHPTDDEWYWEALGLMELFADTVCVGGRIHSHGAVLEAGRFAGFGDGFACPDRGRPRADPGFFAQMWKPHSVGAVSAMHAVFDAAFLADALREGCDAGASIAHLGAWAGAVARRRERRVVYSPMLDARTTIDWDALVSAEERGDLVARFADIMPDCSLRSPHLGRTPALAYAPIDSARLDPAAQGIALPGYGRWQATYLADRLARAGADSSAGRESNGSRTSDTSDVRYASHASYLGADPVFSVLTTLYHGTDTALFRLTARTVLEQTFAHWQWVVLAHGPISPELDLFLRSLAAEARVRVLRLATNLGIMGGMRHVLEAATGQYVIPLDGDDLLTRDALQLLAAAISEAPEPPAYLYTDEDIIVGEAARWPYLRPDWDPVLDLENSWIWHVGAFRRDLALQLGAYSNPDCEYCHDWDTLYRFSRAGHRPLHLREIAYHWRHHERSTSNSQTPAAGSAASVRHLLQIKIADRGLADVCRIAPYPLWRGAVEWWIERGPDHLPPLVALLCGATKVADAAPLDGLRLRRLQRGAFVPALRGAVAGLSDDTIVLLAGNLTALPETAAFLEAIKLFEFVDALVAVSGRLLRGETIAAAGFVTDEAGLLRTPGDGRAAGDPGPYALAWKPHCITAPVSDLCFVRADFLRSAAARCPEHCTAGEFGLWLGAAAAADGRLVGHSPLIVGEVGAAWRGGFDPITTQLTWEGFLRDLSLAPPPCRRGAAGYGILCPG